MVKTNGVLPLVHSLFSFLVFIRFLSLFLYNRICHGQTESLSDQSECSSQIEADDTLNNKLSNGSFEPRLSAQSQQQLIGSVADGRVNDWNCTTQNGLNVKSHQQQDDNSKPVEDKSGDNDEDDNDQSPPWQLPENITFFSVLWWTIQLPAKTLLLITIPDCRRRGRKNLFFITFTMSCGYIALLTYLCVWMVTIIGNSTKIAMAYHVPIIAYQIQ